MRATRHRFGLGLRLALMLAVTLLGACAKTGPATGTASDQPARHEHHPPHGGTPVVLGEELYHLELVRDAVGGTLQAYVLDGEMETFVRISQSELILHAVVAGQDQTLVLHAVASPATGETIGDTALFTGQADWLRTTSDFDGRLEAVTVRGQEFRSVSFNFPRGNDRD